MNQALNVTPRLPSRHGARSLLRPTRNCQQREKADHFRVLIDAADYFSTLRAAMTRANHSIYIVGWDIDSRLKLVPGEPQDDLPAGLADFLCALAEENRHLRIHILAWDFAMLYAFEREWLPAYKMGWRTHRRIRFRQDGRHPLGASHHQKIVVIDDALAFAGGIDLTRSRWDTPAHAPDAPLRRNADDARYQPMHDVQAMFDGDAARAIGVLVRERWQRATGKPLDLSHTSMHDAHEANDRADIWPADVLPDIEEVELGISLTEPAFEGRPVVSQIQRLYLDAIAAATRSVYIENQYFTASRVGASLAARLADSDGPDIAVVGPERQSGWLQDATMGVLRAKLHESLKRADGHGRYAMYAPTIGGIGGQIINVHSKLMIVDDELLIVGSANLNNRSMVLDTECNIALDACGEPRVQAAIASVRNRLLAEHLDVSPGDVRRALDTQRLNEAIAALRHGKRTLMRLDPVVSGDLEDLAARVSVLDAEAPVAPHELVQHFLPEERSRPLTGKLLAFGTLALIVVVLAALWRFTPLRDAISFSALVHGAQQLHASRLGPLAIVAVYAIAASVSVPVTLLIAVSGFVFGALAGSTYAFTGTMISAFITYYAGASLGHDAVRRLAGSRLNRISEKLGKRGLVAVIVLRVVPVAPFTVINLAAGASHIGLRDFLVGTALGMAPGIALATTFAHQLVAAVRHPTAAGLGLVALIGAALIGLSIALQRLFAHRR
ncbi:Phosphatidylserine/phosphatidylglycerophosphate [Paraburkholderia piptadeniae]|uniref:Phosphatidylserine/phosphatidylglycerophosphate n=1 Tax=Paraburkholderia piptadeniae TaxID=1701573 RepID=A0A1N7SJL7_9BURK|nr:VTT domain-containing protein [Paraburkholderia piptadeniae]SIT47502.1 Phosphatidylserine/phosphatidylglycerophosphate [Paraburkholderia piptadeniae]